MKIDCNRSINFSQKLFRFYPNTPAYFGWQAPETKSIPFFIKISISGPTPILQLISARERLKPKRTVCAQKFDSVPLLRPVEPRNKSRLNIFYRLRIIFITPGEAPRRQSHPPKRAPASVFIRSAKIIFRPIAGAIVARNDCRAPNAGGGE